MTNVQPWTQRIRSRTTEQSSSRLRVATYNVHNLNPEAGDPDPSNNDRLDRLAHSIIKHLKNPDIIALQEIQDNDGPKDTGVTDASESLQNLVDAIVAQGGPRYAFTDIAPANNQDGGQPGSNIRQAFLYNPEKVTLRDAPKGRHDQHTEIIEAEDGVHLAVNPGRIHPEFHCFKDSRKPLVAEFIDHASGESLFVANVHLVSKAGDASVRDKQRAVQATTIGGFVTDLHDALKARGQDANILVTGDFNALPHEFPVQTLDDKPFLQNLAKGLQNGDYYTYVHRGQKIAIDHIIGSVDITRDLEAEAVKVNAGKPRRQSASDHNPVVVEVDLARNPEPKHKQTQAAMGR